MNKHAKFLMAATAIAFTFVFCGLAQAQQDNRCQWACNNLFTEGTIQGAEEFQQCVKFCSQVQLSGIEGSEGISIACMYALPKACGYELAWDFIRYCLKPCMEFNEYECGKCLAQHSYCHKGTACHEKVCDCIIKQNCDAVLKKACDH